MSARKVKSDNFSKHVIPLAGEFWELKLPNLKNTGLVLIGFQAIIFKGLWLIITISQGTVTCGNGF